MTSDELLRVRDEHLSWRRVSDAEIIVLDLRASRYLAVNETGVVLWEMLVEGADRRALADRLVSSFDIGRDRADADVEAFVAMLDARKLLQR